MARSISPAVAAAFLVRHGVSGVASPRGMPIVRPIDAPRAA